MCRMICTLAYCRRESQAIALNGWWVGRVDWLLHDHEWTGWEKIFAINEQTHLSWWSRVCEQMNDLMNNPERPIRRQFMGGSSALPGMKDSLDWSGVEMHCAKRLIKSTNVSAHPRKLWLPWRVTWANNIEHRNQHNLPCTETMATERHQNSSATLDHGWEMQAHREWKTTV